MRWRGPLGLVEIMPRRSTLDVITEVVPNVRGVQTAALQFITNEAIFGEKVQQKGEGTEFEALREYRPGHDIRFIDWKHSARHRKLLTKEFRTERNHHIVLAFDTGHLMMEPLGGIPRLDHAINAGLRLGWVSLRAGDLVGTFGFDAAGAPLHRAAARRARVPPPAARTPPTSITTLRRRISPSVSPN